MKRTSGLGATRRGTSTVVIAVVIAAVVISSSLAAAVIYTNQGTSPQSSTSSLSSSSISPITLATHCATPSPLPDILQGPSGQGYGWSVDYAGQWNATAVGITGNGTVAFTQCYLGDGTGYAYIPDWSASGGTTLSVGAHKTDAGNGTLALALNGQVGNTSAPHGSVALTAYLPVVASGDVQSGITDGLQLTATFSPVIAQGSNLTVSAQVYNTLSTEVQVNATSMTNPAYGPCQQGLATGVDVYQGDYTTANLTQGAELLLYNPLLTYTCPEVFTFQYSFAPNGDNATVEQIPGGQTTTEPVSETSTLAGYWTGSGQNYTFHTFPVGNYTLVVFDAWGQTAIGHFDVDLKDSTTSNASSETSSTDSALVEQCPDTGPGSGFGTVTAGTGSPALVCVQLYYYSATPLNVNLTGALSVQALQYTYNGSIGTPRSFSGASNFTISASQSQLTIGGPNDENEGTVVAYAVTAKAGASGTYELGFLTFGSLHSWMLGAQEPEQCGYYGQLVAANGQPNYFQPTGCITYTTTSESSSTATSSSSGPTIPGIPYQLISGDLYFRIVGATSSTG